MMDKSHLVEIVPAKGAKFIRVHEIQPTTRCLLFVKWTQQQVTFPWSLLYVRPEVARAMIEARELAGR